MKRVVTVSALACLGLALVATRPAAAQDMQQKIAAAKQAAAQNQQALKQYSWIEKTEISLKGEVKSTKVESCQYGPDGKVQKTPLSAPPPDQGDSSGGGRHGRLKEKMIEKKKGEMQDEMKAAAALVQTYLPPNPEKIQAAQAAGKITVAPGAAGTALRIADYEKAGDALVLTLKAGGKGMEKVDVDTWLDSPDDKVTLDVQMGSLPDGTSYAETTLLSIPSSQIAVKITSSNYQKLAQ